MDYTPNKGINFVRALIANACVKGDPDAAVAYAATRWGEDSPVAKIARGAVAKDVSAGSTATGSWSADLVAFNGAQAEFVAAVREASVIGRLTGLRRINFNIRTIVQTGGFAGSWVGEGKAMGVGTMTFDTLTLPPLKVTALTTATREALENSSPAMETVIRDDLVRALSEAVDAAFLNPLNTGVSGEMPAAATNGVMSIPASGSLADDLANITNGTTIDLTRAFLVGRPELLVSLVSSPFPNVGARGGELAGIPTIASRGVPNDVDGAQQLILIDPTGIAIAEGDAELKSSTQGTIQMLDPDSVTMDSVTPTGTSVVSLWQTNTVALGALQFINWQLARPGAIAILDGLPNPSGDFS